MNLRKNGEEKQSIFFYFILISCLCLLMQLYALPYRRTNWMSLSNRTLLVIWIPLAAYQALKHYLTSFPRYLMSVLLVLGVSMLAFLFGIVDNSSKMSENFFRLMGFLTFPLMFLCATIFPVTKRTKLVVLLTNIALSLLLIYLYHTDLRHVYPTDYGDFLLDEVTLGYSNPNQTAMYLFVCTVNLTVAILTFKNPYVKFLLAADCAYMIWILYQTESRTAIIALVVFAVMLYNAIKKNVRQRWIGVVLSVPLLYAVLAQVAFSLLGNITIMQESLFNGREDIFDTYFRQLNLSRFLFGNFNNFQFDNLHNGYISIAGTTGIIVLVSYVIMFNKGLTYNLRRDFEKSEKAGYIGFLCLILYSSTEAAFFVGGATYAFLMFTIYVLFSRPYQEHNGNRIEESP